MFLITILFLVHGVCMPALGAAEEEVNALEERGLPTCRPQTDRCLMVGGNCVPNYTAVKCSFNYTLCGPSCTCCIDCRANSNNSSCVKFNGSCRAACLCSEYKNPATPCNSRFCNCCQACRPTLQCSTGSNPGACVGSATCCNSPTSYISSANCVTRNCACCKTCQREQKCVDVDGYCLRANLSCKPNYVAFACGCNDDKNCKCCVPKSNQEKFSCNGTPPITTKA
ncbi:cadmium metallothionein-like [Procambarus clarkii]|uniref:cadmium metallothionein-like n=1 Tax=Procambarus clarkii TaxID=6728 RepID=UPI00374237FF